MSAEEEQTLPVGFLKLPGTSTYIHWRRVGCVSGARSADGNACHVSEVGAPNDEFWSLSVPPSEVLALISAAQNDEYNAKIACLDYLAEKLACLDHLAEKQGFYGGRHHA